MGFVIICFTQNTVKKGHVPEKLCSSLMLDGAVGIKKMNAEQGKMSSLPNLPVQVCHLFVFRRRKISKKSNALYIYYRHTCRALWNCNGQTDGKHLCFLSLLQMSQGGMANGKNLLCSKFAVDKTKDSMQNRSIQSLYYFQFFQGGF